MASFLRLRRQARDVLAIDPDSAGVRRLQARDDAQQGGLAAARRTQQRHETAALDRQRDAIDGGRTAPKRLVIPVRSRKLIPPPAASQGNRSITTISTMVSKIISVETAATAGVGENSSWRIDAHGQGFDAGRSQEQRHHRLVEADIEGKEAAGDDPGARLRQGRRTISVEAGRRPSCVPPPRSAGRHRPVPRRPCARCRAR